MKKTIQKLLSVVLVMAICISTVCGCIISAYAATTNNTYSIVGDAVAAGTKTTTMTVTITDPDGISSGSFDLMFGSDVIDDANFGTKLNDKGETVPDYDNYLSTPSSFTLADLVGERVETSEVTDDFEEKKVEPEVLTTVVAGSAAPTAEQGYVWKQTENHPTTSETVETNEVTANFKDGTTVLDTKEVVAGSAAPTADFGYVWKYKEQTTKTTEGWQSIETYAWSRTGGTVGETPDTSDWTTVRDEDYNTLEGETTDDNGNRYRWVRVDGTKTESNGFWDTTYYKYQKQQYVINSTTYDVYEKYTRTYYTTQTTTYDEYAKYKITYYTYSDSKLDKDGNNMIATVNVYKTVNIYDENGNKTGEKQVIDTNATKENYENSGNKGTLLPNVFDNSNGLWNTRIEITGGTRLNDNGFSIDDFNKGDYDANAGLTGSTTNAIAGTTDDGRKYVYNITDDYFKSENTNYETTKITVPNTDTEDENDTKEVYVPVISDKMLHRYYREYTTVDVETKNLNYSISTVSEDTVGTSHQYAQYAQGFKDITFDSGDVIYTSITFTVTLDFGGICDRISANIGVDQEDLDDTVQKGYKYGSVDGHYASENYVGYGKKYQLNLIHAEGDISDIVANGNNASTDFFHVHQGRIDTSAEGALLNEEAIKAAGLTAPDNKTYFGLYNAVCDICKRVTPMLSSTDMPYKKTITTDSGSATINADNGVFAFNNYRNISGMNLTYQNDGSVSLNIHFPSSMAGEQFIITDENGKVFKYSDIIEGTNGKDSTSLYTATDSFYKSKKVDKDTQRYIGALISSAKMITIDGFSASDADKTLYVARYTPVSDTETQLMGITHAISLADYCNKIVNGDDDVYYIYGNDGVYSESDKANILLDKKVAAAFINYAHAAKTALTTPNDYKPFDKTDAWQADSSFNKQWDSYNLLDGNLADKGETGDSWKNAIIIDTAEELAYLNKVGGADTHGKYYKVADGIKYFDMSSGKVDLSKSLDENIATIKAGYNYSGSSAGFQGHFDGNGVTVYGIYNPGSYAGLFSYTKGDVTIKNVNVTMSYFCGSSSAGGIIGTQSKYSDTYPGSLTIEKCSVTNCHIQSDGATYGAGALAGLVQTYGNKIDGLAEVKNCYVNLDPTHIVTTNTDNAIIGGLINTSVSGNTLFSDCVVIGVKPYSTWNGDTNKANQNSRDTHFTNIYTDQDVDKGISFDVPQDYTGRITKLDLTDMQGDVAKTNMPALDWCKTWRATNGYPTLYTPYNTPKAGKTIYWDGTTASGISEGNGTKDDPYIINTVAELAWVVSRPIVNFADTDGKYFKVSDDIDNIVLQSEDHAAVINLNSAAKTKAYFESASDLLTWKVGGWEGTTFCGNIDFNGATIYGLYQNSTSNAALFCNVDAGAVIRNLALKNSYLTKSDNNFQIGAIAAVANGPTYGKATNGIIWFDGITITNNYIYNPYGVESDTGSNDRSGIIMGASPSDAVYIDNCLVYGNDASWGAERNIMPLIASAGNSVPNTVVAPEGLDFVIDYTEKGEYLYFSMIRNSIILGCDPYDVTQGSGSRFNDVRSYENVYTDQPAGTVTFANGVLTFTPAQIQRVSTSDIYGLNAKSVMSELDWYDAQTNPDGAWHCSYLSAMPSLEPINDNFAGLYPAYDTITFTEDESAFNSDSVFYQLHENKSMTFGVYATAMNLKANPYMSFAFALYGDYKTNRDKVSITFKYTVNGIEYVYGDEEAERAALAIPKYVENEPIRSVNGWTNTSGRYHTYKFTGVPVEALVNGIKVYASYEGDAVNAAFTDEYLGTYSISGLGYDFDKLDTEESSSQYYRTRAEAAKALVFYVQAIHARYGDK